MDNTPEFYFDRLIDISNSKYTLLTEMMELTRQQTATVSEDGVESLEKLVGAKQKIIDEINKLDEAFSVYLNRLKHQIGIKSLEEVKAAGIKGTRELQEIIAKIMTLLKDISALEKENSTKVRTLMSQIGSEIKKVRQQKNVNKAYNPAFMQQPSYFIDKKK